MRSPFRPDLPASAVLDDHKPLIRSLERRGLIRGGLSLGALVMLTGCDVKRPEAVESALLAISRFNYGVQALLFDPNKLARTYPASMILRPPKFYAYYEVTDVKPVNGATWRLEVSGLVAGKRAWTLSDLQALPQTSMVIKHICVEGWSYIGGWTGVPLRLFLERVGADLRAKYVAFKAADNYPSSSDMASALHPQTLLALKYGGETPADPFGYPMRLRTLVKLGCGNPRADERQPLLLRLLSEHRRRGRRRGAEELNRASLHAFAGRRCGGRAAHAHDPHLAFIAGGTDLIGLMKDRAAYPERLLDINALPGMAQIAALPEGGLRIGALARMSDVAADREVRRRFPVIAEALLASASGQLRNMASIGGNIIR